VASKLRAVMNRTLDISDEERARFGEHLLRLSQPASVSRVVNRTINQDIFACVDYLPAAFVDLLIIDPPYNLHKTYNGSTFHRMNINEYVEWVDSWLSKIVRLLKPDASIYVCSDWTSSVAIFEVLNRYFFIRNRITWEREKGRGSKSNWKNCSEDIWYASQSKNPKYYPDRVMLKRRVIAPYRHANGAPKDWIESNDGNYRLTHPSNLWTDVTIPFWSMPENTDHPTQKPEKLLAKLILASSDPGDMVFDPFLGSGTTSVVAKKLERLYCGVEIDEHYCLLAEKRLALAEIDPDIQGYQSGVFWERNSLAAQKRVANGAGSTSKAQARLTW
jgi:site-specific DNA-methyltransferase (adenine-specific)